MSTFNSNQKIGDIAAKFPNAIDIFKEYKIDFCCGGDRQLAGAIKEQNLNEIEIIDKMNKAYSEFTNSLNTENRNWVDAPLNELIDRILNMHHAYLYTNLPKISDLTTKIFRVHGQNHPELAQVYKLFHMLKMDLEAHLIKEETIQYPAIREFEKSKAEADLDKAIKTIEELDKEHTAAGGILKELRRITNDYTVPNDACNSYIATYVKLQELEANLFEHIHLENNILFPRLIALKNNK